MRIHDDTDDGVFDEARHLGGRSKSKSSKSKSKSSSDSSKKKKKKASSHRKRSRKKMKKNSSSSKTNIFRHKSRKRQESGGSTSADADTDTDAPDLSPERPIDPTDPDGPDLVPSIPNDAGDRVTENLIYSDPASDPLHPFTLRTFGSSVLAGYSSCADLAADVENAVRHVANDVILANAVGTYSRSRLGEHQGADDHNFDSQDADILEDLDARFGYGTRTEQEDGVDELDVVKTDGRRYVYVAYGHKVLIWDQRRQDGGEGSLLSEIEMPRVLSGEDETEVDEWAPLPNVEGVMLPERDRLVVVVTGYGRSYPYDDEDQPILTGSEATHVMLYDVSEPSEPRLVARYSFDGAYIAARYVDSRVYIITSSTVKSFFHLVQYLERDRPRAYPALSDTDYISAAREVALQRLPIFIDKLVDEIVSKEEDCQNVVRLSLFQTGTPSTALHKSFSKGRGIVESLVRISSFDIDQDDADDVLKTHQSTMFLPTHFADIFAANRVLVVPAQGYTLDGGTRRWSQSTMLVSFTFTLDGPASAMGVGQMLGHPINRYAMGEHEGFLRVATRTRHVLECNSTTSLAQARVDDSCNDWVKVPQAQQHIELLEFPPDSATNAVMERTGWISDFVGMEPMYSVRFDIGSTCLITTVNQTGPFYMADLSNVLAPFLVGTLDLPALSNQLHSMNRDGLILAVGEDIDESTGLPLGLRFSIIGLGDRFSPQVVHSLKEDMMGEQTDAQVQSDYRGSIYLEELGLLLLPTTVTSYTERGGGKFFNGFRVYEVDAEDGVVYSFNISHSGNSEEVWSGCFSDARVPVRALTNTADEGGGDLFTVNMHSAVMVDTSAEEVLWTINFDDERDEEEMCYSY